jgi:hypothetical protein
MADLALAQTTGSIALPTSGVDATFLQIASPAQQRVTVNEWSISFAGTSNTQAEVLCKISQQSTAGTGLTAQNPVIWDADISMTVQSSGQKGFAQSVEPTIVANIWVENIHPQTGLLWQAPFALEFKCAHGKWLGLLVNNSAALNGVCRNRATE